MSEYQLPPIGNEEKFQELICDIFNEIDKTNSYKVFGRKGHNQKGIDVFSSEKNTVIQCKKKDLLRKEIDIKKELLDDFKSDIEKSKSLKVNFNRFYFTSTFKDHPDLDEYCEFLMEENKTSYEIAYWGWDTIEKKIINSQLLLKKYYPNFIVESTEKSDRIQRNVELKKKIQKDFSKLLDYREKQMSSDILLRSIDDNHYPEHYKNEHGEYQWYKVEFKQLYFNGIEVIFGIKEVILNENGEWDIVEYSDTIRKKKYKTVKVLEVGRINFNDIVTYDMRGDEFTLYPHFYCKFKNKGTPYDQLVYYVIGTNNYYHLLENENRKILK